MPWIPEHFSAPALERLRSRPQPSGAVPFFAGVTTGETDALLRSFAGHPEMHHPLRGRIRGAPAFRRFVEETAAWMAQQEVEVEAVDLVVSPGRTIEEVVLHIEGDGERVELPVAIVSERRNDARIVEIRVYFSQWPLLGRHVHRPPLLQPEPTLHASDVVSEYQTALANGDVDAVVATFETDGVAREPAGARYAHRGADALRAFYTLLFSNNGGIPLEHCSVTDDGRACALEYNVVRWGRSELLPEAGVAVYVRGAGGRLTAARIYDDSDPPLAESGA